MKRGIERLPRVFIDVATMNNKHRAITPHLNDVEAASATSGFLTPER
jgi:hypothetical protein